MRSMPSSRRPDGKPPRHPREPPGAPSIEQKRRTRWERCVPGSWQHRPRPAPPAEATSAEPSPGEEVATIAFEAASATIAVDGDATDWAAIEGATITLEQLRMENLEPSEAAEIEFGPLDPLDVTLKVANDGTDVYVLLEVPDAFDYDAEDHNLSASLAVMFRVDEPAPPHMGAEEADLDRG